jgi:alpha-galactosidase
MGIFLRNPLSLLVDEAGKIQRTLLLFTVLALFCPVGPSALRSLQTRELTHATLSSTAPKPPMGWAGWNRYFCDYDENTIRGQAEALVSSGLRDLGYRYILIQECIAPRRNLDGSLFVDPVRFPHGLQALVNFIHERNLKAGIYTDVGAHTCFGPPYYEGSFNHEDIDAETFASWGFDFVEMDYCNRPPGHTGREIYERMARSIQRTGRPMLLYICSWGNEQPWEWAQGVAGIWRTDQDISWEKNHATWGRVVLNFESNAHRAVFSAPNSWNDPDMLEVGNEGLSDAEMRSHFAMWAISAAPLWVGTDVAKMNEVTRCILANAEVIAVDQDALGAQATRVQEDEPGIEVWSKPLGALSSGEAALLLLNLQDRAAKIEVRWKTLGLQTGVVVRDLWAHKDLGSFAEGYEALVPSHGSVMLRVTGKFNWIRGATYEAEWTGNLRHGNTRLLQCSVCNQGYAVSLRGESSSIEFRNVQVPTTGEYLLQINYLNGGIGATPVELNIDSGETLKINLLPRVVGWQSLPIRISGGEHSIRIAYSGSAHADIDSIRISQPTH